MKNIHVLPTENESRLRYNSFNKVYELCEFPKYHTDIKSTHNIYITSDEEIKEEDYFIAYSVTIDKKPYISCASEYKEHKKEKGKIILTTDVDLIKYGVQAIDDEFLEWFVKNPSCEHVTILQKGTTTIIFPTPKNDIISDFIKKEESKQETLEEVGTYQQELFNYLHDLGVIALQSEMQEIERIVLSMQQERMYSEEEVYDILIHHTIELFKKEKITLEDFWNKFKKK